MIKDILKRHPNVKNHIAIGLVVSAVYVGVLVLSLDRSMWLGFFQLVGLLQIDLSSIVGPVFVNYMFVIFRLLTPIILIFLILTVLKKKRAFLMAILSTMLAYIPYSLLTPFLKNILTISLVIFAAMFVAYLITQSLIKKFGKSRYIWGLAILLIVFNLFALPYLSSMVSRYEYKKMNDVQIQTAVSNMDFKAYYPTYTPEGLKTTQPELEGYGSKYTNENVVFNVGKLEFRESKKLIGQEQVLNFTTNCDISSVWFEMRTNKEIDQKRITRSLDNLSICSKLGTTDDGYDVYVEKNNSQYIFYFMAIGDTNIVMQHDTLPRPRYAEDFDKEVFKIFNSMKVVKPSDLRV